jgi:transcriptional regulator with XRE-family HTH domain
MEPRDVFAANLAAMRTKKKLSQEELAARCGLHRTEISLLERAGREPRLSTMVLLAQTLELPVSRLLKGVDESTPNRGPLGLVRNPVAGLVRRERLLPDRLRVRRPGRQCGLAARRVLDRCRGPSLLFISLRSSEHTAAARHARS